MTNEEKLEAVANEAFRYGKEIGMKEAYKNRENADGCIGCVFSDNESWELPCRECRRNKKDFWRGR